MIKVRCQTEKSIKLGELVSFQGDLKKRTDSDIKALAASILTEGMIMPFVVWPSEDGDKLLDGHGRLAALIELSRIDAEVASQDFPVLYVAAETEDEAKKLLLQITSSYGKVTKQGAVRFCASIPEYHAPAINKYVHSKPVQRKLDKQDNSVIIRIRVPSDKENAVREIFKNTSYIEVL